MKWGKVLGYHLAHPGSSVSRHLIPRNREGKWRQGAGVSAARIGSQESQRCSWHAQLFVRGGLQILQRVRHQRVRCKPGTPLGLAALTQF